LARKYEFATWLQYNPSKELAISLEFPELHAAWKETKKAATRLASIEAAIVAAGEASKGATNEA
jgi:hypothetical protein